jgi:hypothetical protein
MARTIEKQSTTLLARDCETDSASGVSWGAGEGGDRMNAVSFGGRAIRRAILG